MRKFKERFGKTVDLDDPQTFDYLPNDWAELDNRMFKNIGFALVYVKHFHPDWCEAQTDRINVLIKHFADNRHLHYEDVMWYKEQSYLFEEETENMC